MIKPTITFDKGAGYLVAPDGSDYLQEAVPRARIDIWDGGAPPFLRRVNRSPRLQRVAMDKLDKRALPGD